MLVEKAYSTGEVAAQVGVNRDDIGAAIAGGMIPPGNKVGNRYAWYEPDIDRLRRWLSSKGKLPKIAGLTLRQAWCLANKAGVTCEQSEIEALVERGDWADLADDRFSEIEFLRDLTGGHLTTALAEIRTGAKS